MQRLIRDGANGEKAYVYFIVYEEFSALDLIIADQVERLKLNNVNKDAYKKLIDRYVTITSRAKLAQKEKGWRM